LRFWKFWVFLPKFISRFFFPISFVLTFF
jgi:hypothetical protein